MSAHNQLQPVCSPCPQRGLSERPDGGVPSRLRPATTSTEGRGGDRTGTLSYHNRHSAERGCNHEQFLEIYEIEQQEKASGVSAYKRPMRAYISHRHNARRRGVEWHFTLWSWWCVWRDSGHWNQRGPGAGYVMCRRGDIGPYAPDNVYIAKAIQNSAEGSRPLGVIPIGVRYRPGRKYQAKHRGVHLGTFETVEEAAAAYAKASNFTEDLLVRT